ncbi:glutamine--fructose-6-phosphate transaminase (isomerizing) [Natronosalvus vescus]|uniref:glutamine--fructose-6-phosphate transaminase (isomerizing) n=1 Tax=Natronosalvus vescus TaxID=2953881 RepID=UPI002090E3EC|nr:glutamine--fructose-6-phosphate transaminase (isomerizing) [Natronosalvus vescus]
MCGIVGYAGSEDIAQDVLLEGLYSLEYRGYDSAGVAVPGPDVQVCKRAGEVEALDRALAEESPLETRIGIGHTRWSTHGPPLDENAHPHTDSDERVAVVHNGIIENYQSLRDKLTDSGVAFSSDTDTEVVPHLIGQYLEAGFDEERAFRTAIDRLEGSYAIAAVFAEGDAIYGTRQDSPLVLGLGEESNYLASDVPAFIEHTDQVVYLEDGTFARIDAESMSVTDGDGNPLQMDVKTIDWDPEEAGKSGYDHYMLKEINEQPTALRQCLRGRVDELDGIVTFEDLDGLSSGEFVQFVACGTSYHAAMFGAQLLRAREIRATATLASEYTPESAVIDEDTLVVGVTQSGETADTLRALRCANRLGARTLAVTNTVGSTAARECDHALYIRAGPEIGVAATKTFASQQVALALVATHLADSPDRETIQPLRDLPGQVQTVLDTSQARLVAEVFRDAEAYFFIGRGLLYPTALEGALKMKEITYKHAEGFAAGELKHGPLALVTEETPVFAPVIGNGEAARKTIGNVKEVEARGAPVVAVTDGKSDVERYADAVLEVPESDQIAGSVLANVQLQLVAYWVANELGRSIDRPRNLAKSVTVE